MRRKTALRGLFAALAAMVAVSIMAAMPAAGATVESAAAQTTIRIWTDRDRKADIERIAAAWGARRGVTTVVVEKGFGDIRDQLKTVQPESAPDVIIGAHDWTGQLAASSCRSSRGRRPFASSRGTRSTRSRTGRRRSGSTARPSRSRTSGSW